MRRLVTSKERHVFIQICKLSNNERILTDREVQSLKRNYAQRALDFLISRALFLHPAFQRANRKQTVRTYVVIMP